MYFIDTNVFLRYFVLDDHQEVEDCTMLLQSIDDGHIESCISSLVLSEIVWAMTSFYKVPRSKIAKSVEFITSLGNIKLVDNYQYDLAQMLFSSFNVKFIDCMIASIPQIQKGEMTIISYDKDFDKLGVKRIEPGDLQIK